MALGKGHQRGGFAEGPSDLRRLIQVEEIVLGPELGEPADFVHAGPGGLQTRGYHNDASQACADPWGKVYPLITFHAMKPIEPERVAMNTMSMASLRSVSRVVGAVLVAVALSVQSGCVVVAAGAAGAGTVAYIRGELSSSVDAPYENVVRAANRGIQQLEFAKISENKDALTAILVSRTADDKKIEVKITKISDATTRVQIRVGVFGNESLSMTVLDKVKENL